MPFPITALQVDGGTEFQAVFEQACQQRGICLFVLPPRSPKLNGHAERAKRTYTEEFYEVYEGDLEMGPLNQALREWVWVYNVVRPHQVLRHLTPEQYLEARHARGQGTLATLQGRKHVYGITWDDYTCLTTRGKGITIRLNCGRGQECLPRS